MVSGEQLRPRAPRLFLDAPDLGDPAVLQEASVDETVTIRGASVHRLGRVLRLRRGDVIEVIHEPSGLLHRLELLRLTPDLVEARITEARTIAEDDTPPLSLCPAIVRAPRFDTLVEKATELGVASIRPVRATRSLAQSQGRERSSRWKRLATEASEQCRRERRPEIADPIDLIQLVEEPPAEGVVRLFASARERSRRIGQVLRADAPPRGVELLIGPEGGFTESEAEAAVAHDWLPVSLGPRALRAETAAIVATALVQESLRPLG